jgi:flagellar motility protein MotE (MotC chaperone)
MKVRPLTAIAIMLAAFGAVEAGRLGLKATNAFASSKEASHGEAAGNGDHAEGSPTEGEGYAAAPMEQKTCVPVDLAKEAGISAAEYRLLQSLQDRRITLDERENDIITREGILKTAEGIVQNKIDNLHQVEANIQKLLGQVDEMEAQRIAGLVRVYEKMKPKDAASVMEGMSDEVLIAISSKMKEQSLALILAKMNPIRAREITAKLAQIDQAQLADAMTNPPKAQAPNPQKQANNQLPKAQDSNPLPNSASAPTAPNAPKTQNPTTQNPVAPNSAQPSIPGAASPNDKQKPNANPGKAK